MTTEELNALNSEVAKVMGIPTRLINNEVIRIDKHEPWQPTRDPRCERIVVEWIISQKRFVTTIYDPAGKCVVEISVPGSKKYSFWYKGDSPGIALCLAVVEAFGGGEK